MKKLLLAAFTVALVFAVNTSSKAMTPSPANTYYEIAPTASNDAMMPIYIDIRVGLFAKWGIRFGDCPFGWGICLSIGLDFSSNNAQMHYDAESEKLGFTVKRDSDAYDRLEESLNIETDGQVDPAIASKLGIDGKLYVKKGRYTATIAANGDKTVMLNYEIR